MSDVFIPGISSRFNTGQLVEEMMRVERIPRDRTERNIESLQAQRAHWQELGRRMTSLRDSSRSLFGFNNPFTNRISTSADESVITATATRGADEQSLNFSVRQTASADRFLSSPLEERTRIEPGTYTFTVGDSTVSFNFRGGTLREFTDVLNRRGRDLVSASLIQVQPGTRSLLIESRVTGSANRLGFEDAAADLAVSTGMMERSSESRSEISILESTVRRAENAAISINDGVLQVGAGSSASLPMNINIPLNSPLMLRLDTSTRISDTLAIPQPPPGPSIPTDSVSFGGITVENNPSTAPFPEWTPPPPPQRRDDLAVLNLVFSDGTTARLPAITDTANPMSRQFMLSDIAQGRTITALSIENNNTHREVSVGSIEIFDPTEVGGLRPVNAVATARDAIIVMEGIEVTRPTNNIDDLVTGVTLNIRGVSERPVELQIRPDVHGVKDAIISFVGNYNRLMAEINVLTRSDPRIVDELTYLTSDEAAEMRERLGVFSGDTTLNSLRNNLMRIVSAPFPTDMERDLALLAQIGISTNATRASGIDASRLRGYLEIDERVLDAALETNMPAIRQLFASDTTGDRLMDTGIAFNVDAVMRPFVEMGGIITLRQNTIDSRISQDERRITNLDRQLAAREQELRMQFARMEAAYAQMERMSQSFDNFNQQQRGNR